MNAYNSKTLSSQTDEHWLLFLPWGAHLHPCTPGYTSTAGCPSCCTHLPTDLLT